MIACMMDYSWRSVGGVGGINRIGTYAPPFFERLRFDLTMWCCVYMYTVNTFHSNLDPRPRKTKV